MPMRLVVAHRLAQQRVGVLAALARAPGIRRLEEPVVDLARRDEVDDVHALRLLDGGGLEILLGEHDEVPLRVLVALDEVPAHATGRPSRAHTR